MTLQYGVYGLRLGATEKIPFLPQLPGSAVLDITADFLESPQESDWPILSEAELWYRSWQASGQSPECAIYRGLNQPRFWFCYDVGTTFEYEPNVGRLSVSWRAPQTFEDTCTYLTGPVLGFLLQMRHRLCLHASVALIGSSAVAFVGPNGVGKSTLLAALLKQGAQVVTEDVAAIECCDAVARVHYGPRVIRLWSPSVTALCGHPDALPPISKHWEKQYLELGDPEGDWESGVPLTGIYLLKVTSPDAAVVSEPLPPVAAVSQLLANIYPGWLTLPEAQSATLDTLSRLVTGLPVAQLCLPNCFTRLQDVCAYLFACHG